MWEKGGLAGYIRALPKLRRVIKSFNPDVTHAHYSFSGFLSSLAGAKPLVVSLMGSEAFTKKAYRNIISFFERKIWSVTLVKTEQMAARLKLESAVVLPNGVDINLFGTIEKKSAVERTGWSEQKINVLFVADPERVEKNYILAERAVKYINDSRIKLITVSGIPNTELPFYYNAADVLILTSLWEGSPNVIKEAMACNCPIVSTDVGDVRSILGETEGTYLTSFDYRDVAEKLSAAIKFTETSGRTKGRERIIEKGLDSGSVSEKLINIYISVIKSKEKLKQ